jgi:serine/threonine protein kinase
MFTELTPGDGVLQTYSNVLIHIRLLSWLACALSQLTIFEFCSALREIRVLKEVTHPNVVGLLDAFFHERRASCCSRAIEYTIIYIKPLNIPTKLNIRSFISNFLIFHKINHTIILTFPRRNLWIVYEYAPQDLGRTLRDPSVARSPAHIKAWAKMLLEGSGLGLFCVLKFVLFRLVCGGNWFCGGAAWHCTHTRDRDV